ncbi:hypothetical protein FKM82_019057 [Ascaphus truei]
MYLQGRGQNRRRSYAGLRNQSGIIAQNNGVCFNCGGFGHWQRVYHYQSEAGKSCFARGAQSESLCKKKKKKTPLLYVEFVCNPDEFSPE